MVTAPSISMIQANDHWGFMGLPQIVNGGDIAIVWADLGSIIEPKDLDAIKLTEEEYRRAEGYVQEADRDRFIQRRRILRRLLGVILRREPKDIVLRTDVAGKPFVDPISAPWPVSFSLSHSRDRAVFAFGRNRPIGIDIEYRDPSVEIMKMASVICTQAERERLGRLAGQEQLTAFYDCWCIKETFIKAAGVRDPQGFEVSFYPHTPRLLRLDNKPADVEKWSFQRIDLGIDWTVMLAVEKRLWPIQAYQVHNAGGLTIEECFHNKSEERSSSFRCFEFLFLISMLPKSLLGIYQRLSS